VNKGRPFPAPGKAKQFSLRLRIAAQAHEKKKAPNRIEALFLNLRKFLA
jgi:hypothetical protein